MMAVLLFGLLSIADPNAICWEISNPVSVDPNMAPVEFGSVVVYSDRAYKMPQDYLLLLANRWMLPMPVAPRLIEGNTDMFVLRSPSQTSGTLEELAIWAKRYTGWLVWKPQPPPPAPPQRISKLEVMAMFMELFMETNR